MIDLDDIRAARERLAGILPPTPCVHHASLSECTGAEVWLKLENLQRTGSFKVRGALNRILTLEPEVRERGVIAASAGNHAQGVAFAAAHVGVPATIVMPERTPLVKIERTRALGAEVILQGAVFDEAQERAVEIAGDQGLTVVPPFDQGDVIAGQGTVGLEILDQVPEPDWIVVGIGGGGLIAGIATGVRAARPETRIRGVQSEAAPAMKRSFDAGTLAPEPVGPTIAEGLTVRQPGRHTFDIIRDTVEAIDLVSEGAIEAAIFHLLDSAKVVSEGAGAAPFAALVGGALGEVAGRTVVLVVSGGNIDPGVMARVIERSLVQQRRLIRLRVRLWDRPGALAGLLQAVAADGANVRRVDHDRSFAGSDFWEASVELVLETRDPDHGRRLIETLVADGYPSVEELD